MPRHGTPKQGVGASSFVRLRHSMQQCANILLRYAPIFAFASLSRLVVNSPAKPLKCVGKTERIGPQIFTQKPGARSEVLAGLAVEGRLPARIDLDAEPDLRDATPWLQAARRLRHYKRYDAALAACDEAIARAPGDPEPLTVKYVILRNRLRWREALPLWREMTRLHMEQWRREQALRDEGRR